MKPKCSYRGKYIWPLEKETCPCCGGPLSNSSDELSEVVGSLMDSLKKRSPIIQNNNKNKQSSERKSTEEENRELFTITIDSNAAQSLGELFRDFLSKPNQESGINNGKPLRPKTTINLQPFRDSSTGKYGYSRFCEIVIPAKYDQAFPFSADGTAKVIVNRKLFVIDENGHTISDETHCNGFYSLPYGCSSSNLSLTYDRSSLKYGYSFQGKLIIPTIYQNASPFQQGVASVKQGGKNYRLIEEDKYIIQEETF